MSHEAEQTEPRVPTPSKKRRIFPWIFIGIQIVFLIWIIGGVSNANSGPCDPAYQSACDIGTGIGAALVIGLWVAVDFILGVSYLVWKLAKR